MGLLIALFLSPFASLLPDGLEKVAETKDFQKREKGGTFWKVAPFSDYTLPG